MPRQGQKLTCMTQEDRINATIELFSLSEDGITVPHGTFDRVAKKFKVNGTTISRLWQRVKVARANPDSKLTGVESRRKNCGRRPIYDPDKIGAAVKMIPIKKRGTYRDMSMELGIPKSTLHRIQQKTGNIRPHTIALKPALVKDKSQNPKS